MKNEIGTLVDGQLVVGGFFPTGPSSEIGSSELLIFNYDFKDDFDLYMLQPLYI